MIDDLLGWLGACVDLLLEKIILTDWWLEFIWCKKKSIVDFLEEVLLAGGWQPDEQNENSQI